MKVPIRLTLDIDYEIYDGWKESDPEAIRFFLEENHCVENIIRQLHENQVEGYCTTCSHAEVKLLDRPLHEEDE